MHTVRLLPFLLLAVTACTGPTLPAKQDETALLALSRGNIDSAKYLKQYQAAIHETADLLDTLSTTSRISFDKAVFLKMCYQIPARLNARQDDAVAKKMARNLEAIEAQYPAEKYGASAKIWSVELNKLEHSRFEAFLAQLAAPMNPQSKQRVNNVKNNIEASVEYLLQALLIWQSEDPEETRQYHLESQRLFKAEGYLRFLDALEQSVRH